MSVSATLKTCTGSTAKEWILFIHPSFLRQFETKRTMLVLNNDTEATQPYHSKATDLIEACAQPSWSILLLIKKLSALVPVSRMRHNAWL